MKIVYLLFLITFSFFVFACSNSDNSKGTVKKNEEVAEEKKIDDNKKINVFNDENLKTIEGLKNYLQGGWVLENKDTKLYYYFDNDSLIHYIIASDKQKDELKENNLFIEKSKKFSKARESKVIYNENETITSVTSSGNNSNASIKVIDDNSFVLDFDNDKKIFKRINIEKPIVGKIYQKFD